MGTTKATSGADGTEVGSLKRKRCVQVVTATSPFPISTKPKKARTTSTEQQSQSTKQLASSNSQKQNKQTSTFLDWHDTVKEVRNFGATAFVGKQKRDFKAEQYKALTGRDKKGQRIPLPILRGMKKKAAKREARQLEEAKAAGIVMPTAAAKDKRKKDSDDLGGRHGPTPSIGYVNKGVLNVKRKPF